MKNFLINLKSIINLIKISIKKGNLKENIKEGIKKRE
jgi:hypothetical protein